MGCVLSSKSGRELNSRVFDVLNVDDHGQERNPGKIEVTDSDLILYQSGGKEPIKWPLNSLRRYGFDAELFSFECGRRCPTGPGIYAFRCKKPEPLFNLLQEAIMRAGQNERIHAHSAIGGTTVSTPGVVDPLRAAQNRPNGLPPDQNRIRLLGGRTQNWPVQNQDGPFGQAVGGRGHIDPHQGLLLSNWAGAEEHRTRLSSLAGSNPLAPNTLAALGRRTLSQNCTQREYINTEVGGSGETTPSSLVISPLQLSHDYENHISLPFRGKWITSSLASREDDENDVDLAPRGAGSKSGPDVHYADLDLGRHDSLNAEGIPEDDEEAVEEVFQSTSQSDVNASLQGVINPAGSSASDNSTRETQEEGLVYINIPGNSCSSPVVSTSTDPLSRADSSVHYANISSPPPTSSSHRPQRSSSQSLAPTARLQPLGKSRLPPNSPSFSSQSGAPSNCLNHVASSATSKSPTPQKITYVQLDLQESSSTPNGVINGVKANGSLSPLSPVGRGRDRTIGAGDFPRGTGRSVSISSASGSLLLNGNSESYTTIDFQKTLALNSKCSVDEGVRKTRHNSHIEMIALN